MYFALAITTSQLASSNQGNPPNPVSASECHPDNFEFLKNVPSSQVELEMLLADVTRFNVIHLIGEAHGYTDFNHVEQLLLKFQAHWDDSNTHRRQEKSCLFLELPPGAIDLFDQELRFELSRSPQQRRIEKVRLFRYYLSIFSTATQLGYKVVLSDHPDQISVNVPDRVRTEFIATAIDRHLKHGECDRALALVGKARISPLDYSTLSVSKELQIRGRRAISYLLPDQLDQHDARLQSALSPQCKSTRQPLKAIRYQDLIGSFTHYPFLNSERAMLWNDFDYLLLD